MDSIVTMVKALATAMFEVGGQLITFITEPGHEIVLAGLVLFILVALIGGIRKLLPGV